MDCNEARALVPAYVDREVGLSDAGSIEAHLRTCAACRAERDLQTALKDAVAAHANYVRAPSALTARVMAAIDADASATPIETSSSTGANPRVAAAVIQHATPPWGTRWFANQWMVAAAMTASLAAVILMGGAYLSLPSADDDRLGTELVASHVRSLVSGHGTDVASSDQHTVKPWFNGRIDYAPPVHDLAGEGFPLVGGRVDYVDHRRVATLSYQRRLHTIDVYVWPDARAPSDAIRHFVREGFHLLGWSHQGMQYWAVSDIDPAELETLRATLDKQP